MVLSSETKMDRHYEIDSGFKNFTAAKPVWLNGKEKEMNLQVGFKCNFKARSGMNYTLLITGSSLYRIYINGAFLHYGPARGPHGYVRVDELNLNKYIKEGINILSIEVAGYNCYSYYTLNIPSFLQAEILENERVIHSTGQGEAFKAFELSTRVKKTARYSFQRTFTEVYHFDNNDPLTNWISDQNIEAEIPAVIKINKKYLPREVPIPDFNIVDVKEVVESGIVKKIDGIKIRHGLKPSESVSAYPLEEIEERPFEELQHCLFEKKNEEFLAVKNGRISAVIDQNEYILMDMGLNNSGFIITEIEAFQDSEVYIVFDEKLINGNINVGSLSTINIVKYSLKASDKPYRLETFETYGFRYVKCLVLKGKIRLNYLGLREYSYPNYKNTQFECSEKEINEIFNAALETYRQNTLDVFMDCPTRERGGWLCDSYFTAQSEQYFSGNSIVEKVMLENFVYADEFPFLPEGMLPMCYPADHSNGNFIPQWAMWYVIELDGYFKRSGRKDKDKFKDLCYKLVKYLSQFKNDDGLLEKLDKWNFIEWSDANNWVQDVNYPTNMLYSKMIYLIGKWYDDKSLIAEAEAVKSTIIEQSFDGKCFIDNAVRRGDGKLELTGNRSEVCQYYALFFDVASVEEERFAYLKDLVLNVFGPERKAKGIMPEIAYANAFIGNYLRMEILLRWRQYRKIINEVKGYFYNMAKTTGTLWEHDRIVGSLNHGFASFAGVAIIKALFGIREIDMERKVVVMDFIDVGIDRASCRIGTPYGDICISFVRENNSLNITRSIPKEFKIITM